MRKNIKYRVMFSQLEISTRDLEEEGGEGEETKSYPLPNC